MQVLIPIRSFLLAHPFIQEAGVREAHYNNAPVADPRPNLVLMLIGGSDGITHQGADGLWRQTIRIYSRGDNSEAAIRVGGAVVRALNGASFNTKGISVQLCKHTAGTGDFNETAKVQRQIDSFMVAWRYSD